METNTKPMKILMLEDSPDDINLIERVLHKSTISFVAEHVDTREEFIAAVNNFKPDIVLSDHGLPMFNSREALRICQQYRASMPFIIVTGTMSDEFAITCLQEGADDYLLKSNLSRLPMAINRAIKERKLEKLKREARHALRKQNRELMKVNEELDHFVYSVSHNLRGPIASVLGLIIIAKAEDQKEKVDPLLSMMDSSVKRLDETLKEILDFLRNARAEIKRMEVDWEQIIEKSLYAVKYLDPEGKVKVNLNLQILDPFYSDSHRLRAVFTNLLSNALHFRDSSRNCEITIDAYVDDKRALVRIKDNGIGIESSKLERVFGMFYRGSERSKGAGLGLYIAREVVMKLGGDIKIESEVGVYTMVTVCLRSLQ